MKPHTFRRAPVPVTLLLAILLMIAGCDSGKETVGPVEPIENPAEALSALALTMEQSMGPAFTDLRNRLNAAQSELISLNFNSEGAGDALEEIVQFSNDNAWGAGIVGLDGNVVRVIPESIDSLVGDSWANRPEIAGALSEASLRLGDPERLAEIESVIFTRSIGNTDDMIEGVVFSILNLDSLFRSGIQFAGLDTMPDHEFFALDDSGDILHNTGNGYFADNLMNGAGFSEEQNTLAQAMLQDDQGSTTLDLTAAPGGDGLRYIGWVQLPLVGDQYWVLAVSAPADEEEQ